MYPCFLLENSCRSSSALPSAAPHMTGIIIHVYYGRENDVKSLHAYLLLVWAATELELPQIEWQEPGAFPSQPSAGGASQDWALYA